MEYIEEEYLDALNRKNIFLGIITECISEIKQEIKETIKKRWLTGESVNGGKITNKSTGKGYASLTYKALKILKNPIADGNIDLTLTGSLGDKIDIIITSSGDAEIISTDSKYIAIGTTFGFDEIGLNDNEKEIIMQKLGNLIQYKIDNLN